MKEQNTKLNLLKRQIERNALPHAYLFSGTDEEGKEEAIKYLLGEFLSSPKPSLGQETDLNSVWDRHPDFLKIEADPISIDEVRTMKEKAAQSPLVGTKNIFLIKNIERLSWQAAPAMLKLLEEPSPNIFILATTEDSSRVLPTLKSRFSHIRFSGNASAQGGPAWGGKPPSHENHEEFKQFIRGAVSHARSMMRKNPNRTNTERLARTLRAMDAMSDPTINKRLLGEYITMVLL